MRYDTLKTLFNRPAPIDFACATAATSRNESHSDTDSSEKESDNEASADLDSSSTSIHSSRPKDTTSTSSSRVTTKVVYEEVIRQELDSTLGQWFVVKMETMINEQQVLIESSHRPVVAFLSIWGISMVEYFEAK